jgi:hypothetical protein
MVGTVLWFGKWKGSDIRDVPGDYLAWALRTVRLSSGVRQAIAEELRGRGVAVPPLPPPLPPPACYRCGGVQLRHSWFEDRLGRRQVRRECDRCGQSLGFAPCVSPYTDEADRRVSTTPILDVLVEAEAQGVQLQSDGRAVDFASTADWFRATPWLRQQLPAVRHQLARLIGKRGRSV